MDASRGSRNCSVQPTHFSEEEKQRPGEVR